MKRKHLFINIIQIFRQEPPLFFFFFFLPCFGLWLNSFKKILFYGLCYYTCPSFSPFVPLHPASPTPSGNPHLHVHGSCMYVLWLLHFLYCILHPYSVTTYLYFLIPSPLHSFPHTPLPSHNCQYSLRFHDSISVLFVCLVCFLNSVVDRYVFIAILLFIVFIFFCLIKSL